VGWVLRYTKLRKIGFRVWDPIGLLFFQPDWEDSGFENEYDNYLLRVAAMLCRNESAKAAEQYLVGIEVDEMGLGMSPTTKLRAKNTIQALLECDQLWVE
jgi:hypothetical protein